MLQAAYRLCLNMFASARSRCEGKRRILEVRPKLEVLEERTLLNAQTYTVTNNKDDGSGDTAGSLS